LDPLTSCLLGTNDNKQKPDRGVIVVRTASVYSPDVEITFYGRDGDKMMRFEIFKRK